MRSPVQGRKIWFFFWALLAVFFWGPAVVHSGNQWRIRINIPEYKLYLYRGDKLHSYYPIAVGKFDKPSPTGDFAIAVKISNPTWSPPDGRHPPVPPGPSNPLGKFWMGLSIKGYGIHGNSAPWSIGRSVSLGCFRMRNRDVAELFHLIPAGTPVQIIYKTVICNSRSNTFPWLELFPDIYGREKRELAVLHVATELGRFYSPHHNALRLLISRIKRPCKVPVPREIRIQSEIFGIDGFYWERKIYVSKRILSVLRATTLQVEEPFLFPGYLEVSKINSLSGIQIFWNETLHTLKITRDTKGLLYDFP